MTAWRRYFTEFLPGLEGRLLIDDLRDLTTCFEIEVSDADETPWRVAVQQGRIAHVGQSGGPEPVCRFRLDAATLLEVASGRCPPSEAFFELRIELDGDMETGLKLSTVLEPFFRRHPFPA